MEQKEIFPEYTPAERSIFLESTEAIIDYVRRP